MLLQYINLVNIMNTESSQSVKSDFKRDPKKRVFVLQRKQFKSNSTFNPCGTKDPESLSLKPDGIQVTRLPPLLVRMTFSMPMRFNEAIGFGFFLESRGQGENISYHIFNSLFVFPTQTVRDYLFNGDSVSCMWVSERRTAINTMEGLLFVQRLLKGSFFLATVTKC